MWVACSMVRLIDVCITLIYNEAFINLHLVDYEWVD